MNRALYRAARFYVLPHPRARRLWSRYQTFPGRIAGYVLVLSFIGTVSLVALLEGPRLLHAVLPRVLTMASGFLRHLNP